MRKKVLFYSVFLALLALIFILFSNSYRQLIRYSELMNRYNAVHTSFQNLSKQINNAAIITPDLVNAGGYSKFEKLFSADSASIIQQLELLKSTVKDSMNIQIANTLDSEIRSELSWILRSNVPDSIIHHKSSEHLSSFENINLLIQEGIQRIHAIVGFQKKQLDEAIKSLRVWMTLFIILSITLLAYTTLNLSKQKAKTKSKELSLEKHRALLVEAQRMAHVGSWEWDPVKDVSFWSEEMYHIFGLDPKLPSPNYKRGQALYSPKDWKLISAGVQAAVTNGIPFKTECEIVRPNGEKAWILLTIEAVRNEEENAVGLRGIVQDITEQKKAEENYARLAALVKTSGDAIISKTLNSIVTSWNGSAERIFGYTADEMIGQSIMKIIPENRWNEEANILERIKKGERVDNYETQRLTKDGKLLDVSLTISPIKNNEGTVIGISKIAHDISERKKAENEIVKLNNELLKSETRFRGLIENSYDLVALLDENSKILYRSPSSYKITGWKNEEMEKINILELIHPDDSLFFKKFIANVRSNTGKSFSASFRSRHKDGHYIWLEGVMTSMLHDEFLKGIVANFRDVTESKEAEEKLIRSEKIYKTIASSIPGSVICLLDSDYRYLLVEGNMIEKLGYSKDQLLGKKAEDVLPPEIFAGIEKELKMSFEGEIITRESNSQGYDIISKFIPLKDENNVVYAIMTVAIDVTELKNAQRHIVELNHDLEEKIIQRTEQLKKSNEELEAFSYSISHDLRTPLRAVNGYAKILEEDYYKLFDDEGKRLLTVVQENAKRMGMLIDDLLAFSKLGRKEVGKSLIDMTELAKNISSEINKTYGNKAVFKINPLNPVMADSSLISQVMTNLISNAIKYSSKTEKPFIEISSEKKNGELVYSVSDNGVGFNMKYAHKLFGVFQRLHSEEEFEGTGIGLAIIKRIVTKHNGKVWAKGAPGKGATFYFSLPDL